MQAKSRIEGMRVVFGEEYEVTVRGQGDSGEEPIEKAVFGGQPVGAESEVPAHRHRLQGQIFRGHHIERGEVLGPGGFEIQTARGEKILCANGHARSVAFFVQELKFNVKRTVADAAGIIIRPHDHGRSFQKGQIPQTGEIDGALIRPQFVGIELGDAAHAQAQLTVGGQIGGWRHYQTAEAHEARVLCCGHAGKEQ